MFPCPRTPGLQSQAAARRHLSLTWIRLHRSGIDPRIQLQDLHILHTPLTGKEQTSWLGPSSNSPRLGARAVLAGNMQCMLLQDGVALHALPQKLAARHPISTTAGPCRPRICRTSLRSFSSCMMRRMHQPSRVQLDARQCNATSLRQGVLCTPDKKGRGRGGGNRCPPRPELDWWVTRSTRGRYCTVSV